MKYLYQQLLRIIENITIQENGKLTYCSKESIRGSMKYAYQQQKHNDPREWETHILLKRIQPGNYQQLLRMIENITIQEGGILTFCSKESIRGIMKYMHQHLLRIIKNIEIQENEILTPCSKESIRGMMKYTHQQLLRIIENITIQENGRLTY